MDKYTELDRKCDLASPLFNQSETPIILLLMNPSQSLPTHSLSPPSKQTFKHHPPTKHSSHPISEKFTSHTLLVLLSPIYQHILEYFTLLLPLSCPKLNQMATNSLHHSLQHHSLIKHHHPSHTPSHTPLFLKPPTPLTHPNITLSHTPSTSHITFSLSQTTTSSTTSTTTSPSFDVLRSHLVAKNYQQADEETRRLLIELAGEAAQKRGYVFFSEVQFISEKDLQTIDSLWRKHSDNKFGYSVQKKILEKVSGDFTKFFIKVGWMKKLDTEVEQYNYRSFPNEFIWELNDDTPEGHLPLTNALRGTQLLNNVLNHPAFDAASDKEEEKGENGEKKDNGVLADTGSKENGSKTLSQRVFKPNYSF